MGRPKRRMTFVWAGITSLERTTQPAREYSLLCRVLIVAPMFHEGTTLSRAADARCKGQ